MQSLPLCILNQWNEQLIQIIKFNNVNKYSQWIKKCLDSSSLEKLVICSVCKCDTLASVKYLMREEKKKFGEGL